MKRRQKSSRSLRRDLRRPFKKEIIMKRIAPIALFFAATFISAGGVMAQDHVAKATVPFPFTVSGSSLPAGSYTIGSDSNSANTVIISDRNKSVHIHSFPIQDEPEGQD
jgi:hypothetical protein